MVHARGRFYVRPFGAREYGSNARDTTGGFELIWIDERDLPQPCGRAFRKNTLGVVEVYASNGRICCPESNDEINAVAYEVRRKLMEQGW